jgi:RNA polymerase sigma-70 factor (ECF subfamily)
VTTSDIAFLLGWVPGRVGLGFTREASITADEGHPGGRKSGNLPAERRMSPSTQTEYLQGLLDRHRAGDPAARDALLERGLDRLRVHARKMFPKSDRLRAFDATDDILSKALLRLHRALGETQPSTVAGFVGLASQHIRWVLKDLAREHTHDAARVTYPGEVPDRPAPGGEPSDASGWADFHEAIDRLPEADRVLFDLVHYQGLEQAEAAALLGLPLRTLKRHWQQAKLRLGELLGGADA